MRDSTAARGFASVLCRAREIEAWARELFRLLDDAVVSVNELAYCVPRCPPKETAVLMMSRDETVQVLINKAQGRPQ